MGTMNAGGERDLRTLLTPSSVAAWAKMSATLVAIGAAIWIVALATWATSPWYWWLPPTALASATSLIVVRRGWLLRAGHSNDWGGWDKVLLGVHQVAALVTLVGLLATR